MLQSIFPVSATKLCVGKFAGGGVAIEDELKRFGDLFFDGGCLFVNSTCDEFSDPQRELRIQQV
ncbi:MAG: hypothetical protein WKF77_23215 [Planctomycetaceae bacterium]